MSKLLIALGMGGAGKEYCPDCGCDLGSNGSCPDCGYGDEEMEDEEEGEEEGEDEGEESGQAQALLDIKNELQRVMEKIDRLIVNGD